MNVQPRTLLTANDIRAAGFRPEAGSETVDEQVAHVWYPSSRRGDRWDIGLGLLAAPYVEDADRYWDGIVAELGGGDVAPERVAVGDQAVHADGWLYARYRGQVFWIAVEGPDPVLARWAVERLARTVCPRLAPLPATPPPATPPPASPPPANPSAPPDADPAGSAVPGSGPAAPVSIPPAAGAEPAGPPSSGSCVPADRAEAAGPPPSSSSPGGAGLVDSATSSSSSSPGAADPAGPTAGRSSGSGVPTDRAESAGPPSSSSLGAADPAGPAAGRSSGSGAGAVPVGPAAAATAHSSSSPGAVDLAESGTPPSSSSGGGADRVESAVAPPSSSSAGADAGEPASGLAGPPLPGVAAPRLPAPGPASSAPSMAGPGPAPAGHSSDPIPSDASGDGAPPAAGPPPGGSAFSGDEPGGGRVEEAGERGGTAVLRPKAPAPGRYRRRHLAKASLAVDGGELVTTDARGRERRWALDGGPDAPAAIGLTVDPRHTLGAPVAYLAVVDGAGCLMVRDGELGVWALDDVRRFAAAAGLLYLEPEARTHEVDWHRQPVELEGTPWGFILLSLAALAAAVFLVVTSAPAVAFPAAAAVIVAVGAAGSRAGQVRVGRAPDQGMSDG